ncbi:MAG TPA: helix-turn-helix domain-containing protein [Longimicrobiaceae bacterium]|jgi:AraC-like DNA-binding protein|nr:helix-turn-helix domain-containing protein [Longimicrobiaceae bacterium]
MQTVARPLLVLHSDALFRERLRRIGSQRFQCQFVTDWESLREAVREAPPAALIVVDPYTRAYGSEAELAPELRSLLWEFPSATVIAALEVKRGRIRDLRTLGEWGVKEVIALDEEDTLEAIARRLRSAQGRPLQSLLERSLPATLSGRARTLLMAAAEVVAEGGHGRDLAASLRLSERTLLRWAEQADLPPPRRILAWMRVLLACELLDDPSQTVLSVAYTCGYASDSSLRRAVQEFTGVLLTKLRQQGAFSTASAIFLKELSDAREEGRARRKAEKAQAKAKE